MSDLVETLALATAEADRCGARDVVTFVPFAGQHGPALVTGDACPACAEVLGIRFAEAAS